jgi:fructose-1,6-bisphosphatase
VLHRLDNAVQICASVYWPVRASRQYPIQFASILLILLYRDLHLTTKQILLEEVVSAFMSTEQFAKTIYVMHQ